MSDNMEKWEKNAVNFSRAKSKGENSSFSHITPIFGVQLDILKSEREKIPNIEIDLLPQTHTYTAWIVAANVNACACLFGKIEMIPSSSECMCVCHISDDSSRK